MYRAAREIDPMPDAARGAAAQAWPMPIDLLAPLGVLALIDATSFGTLLIPIWLLMAPGRLRPGRVCVFLGTVASFYLVLGLLLVAGLGTLLSGVTQLLDHPVASRIQLAVGVGLIVWSFFIGKGRGREGEQRQPGRLVRWRDRAMAEDAGLRGLIALALGAALIEVASMLPYLAATGMIGAADLSWPQRVLVLTGYCLVMILPALVLLVLRVAARRAVTPVLQRVAAWLERNGGETTAWIVGIVGFLVARDAVVRVPEIIALLG